MRRPEEAIQRTVAQALDAAGCDWFHCPNGGGRSRVEAAILCGLGVKPGVPDILIFSPPRRLAYRLPGVFVGAAIELKAAGGRVTPEQKGWLLRLGALGWLTAVCYSADEALGQLREWGYLL